MSRRTGQWACIGLLTMVAVAASALAAAQVPPGERATASTARSTSTATATGTAAAPPSSGASTFTTRSRCCYGGEHWSSTILGHAFYLAVEGGTNPATGRAVEGVGATDRAVIEDIFFRALTVHLPAAGTLPRTAAVIRQAAADLHPADNTPYRAVDQALRAAGL